MLKAIIFDCDGVIVDSESHHLKAFQIVLDGEGIPLSSSEYYEKYLALDDKGLFETLLSLHQRPVNNQVLKRLIVKKMPLYKKMAEKELLIYPGVVDFVKKAVGAYRLAIASGAFRGEIKYALDQGGIRQAFPVIVSAQDVKKGKPHPESYLTALAKLNELKSSNSDIQPGQCVVIEDSLHGLASARSAGMKCLAVTSSYPRSTLTGKADRVVDSLLELEPRDLEILCGEISGD